MTSEKRLRALKARQRLDWLIQSLRAHLVPALMKQGFELRPPEVHRGPVDREYVLSFPPWGRLIRAREGGVDLVEIQLAPYRDAAFRINACAVPKEGMITCGGHRTAEELDAGGLHDHFEMYACPRLWMYFFVWRWPWRSPTLADYDKLALRVAGYVPELELALREGRLGPHMRKVVFALPPNVLPSRPNRDTHADSVQQTESH